MRLEKRSHLSPAALVLAPLGAVAFTLVVSSLLVLWAGAAVGPTWAAVVRGGFGSMFAVSETLTRAIPLVLTGLAAAVAFRARLFNIGAEGQLYAGALAAVAVGGLHGGEGFTGLPYPVLFALMVAAAALAGALASALATMPSSSITYIRPTILGWSRSGTKSVAKARPAVWVVCSPMPTKRKATQAAAGPIHVGQAWALPPPESTNSAQGMMARPPNWIMVPRQMKGTRRQPKAARW